VEHNIYLLKPFQDYSSHAMAQAINATSDQSQASVSGICGEESGTGT